MGRVDTLPSPSHPFEEPHDYATLHAFYPAGGPFLAMTKSALRVATLLRPL